MFDLAIQNGSCYIDEKYHSINIYVKDGKIASISDAVLPALKVIDAKGLKVYPGFIDPHVHLNLNLGQFHSADDFESGSKAAAYGGVTTLIDFLDPIYHNNELDQAFFERQKEAQKSTVDYSFHCTLGNYHDDVQELSKMIETKGITSIKVFTTYSESNRRCDYSVIKELLNTKALVLTHAEDDESIFIPSSIEEYEASRSELTELKAVQDLIKLLEESIGKLYIVHVSSGHTLTSIQKHDRLHLESCPQYFYLDNTLFLDEEGAKYLLAPPLRSKTSIDLMKKNFHLINTIGTDHCPFMLSEKNSSKDIMAIPKGIGSLEFTFSLMFALFGDLIIPKITSEPARIFGLKDKGKIKIGYDADFACVSDQQKTVCNTHHSKSDYTVYKDLELNSKVMMTILRGQVIMDQNGFYPIEGHMVRRNYESNH